MPDSRVIRPADSSPAGGLGSPTNGHGRMPPMIIMTAMEPLLLLGLALGTPPTSSSRSSALGGLGGQFRARQPVGRTPLYTGFSAFPQAGFCRRPVGPRSRAGGRGKALGVRRADLAPYPTSRGRWASCAGAGRGPSRWARRRPAGTAGLPAAPAPRRRAIRPCFQNFADMEGLYDKPAFGDWVWRVAGNVAVAWRPLSAREKDARPPAPAPVGRPPAARRRRRLLDDDGARPRPGRGRPMAVWEPGPSSRPWGLRRWPELARGRRGEAHATRALTGRSASPTGARSASSARTAPRRTTSSSPWTGSRNAIGPWASRRAGTGSTGGASRSRTSWPSSRRGARPAPGRPPGRPFRRPRRTSTKSGARCSSRAPTTTPWRRRCCCWRPRRPRRAAETRRSAGPSDRRGVPGDDLGAAPGADPLGRRRLGGVVVVDMIGIRDAGARCSRWRRRRASLNLAAGPPWRRRRLPADGA